MTRLSFLAVLVVSTLACAHSQTETPAAPTPPLSTAEPDAAPVEAEEGTEAETPPPEIEPLSNTIRWKTASEVENFGFHVYRGLSEDGPFDRLNEDIVEGAGTTDEPQAYEWVDDTIEPGVEYWYWVESISMSGEKEQFTPISKARAKGGNGP